MFRYTCYLLYLCVPALSFGQSSTAGATTGVDFYYDYEPDTALVSYTGPDHILHFPIDIDGDSEIDFSFNLKDQWGAQGFQDVYVRLIAHNGNQIAWQNTDTCYDGRLYPMAQSFQSGDTVDNSSIWPSDSILYLDYRKLNIQVGNCQNGIGDAAIIGVRVIGQVDTAYGWIGVYGNQSHSNGSFLSIEAFASGEGTVSIDELGENFRVFPNPCSSKLSIIMKDNTEYDWIAVYNQLGVAVLSQNVQGKRILIDVNELKPGLYSFRLSGANERHRHWGKFVVNRN